MKPLIVEPRQTLRSCVSSVLNEYFEQVDPEMINGLYDMVLSEVEAPLLEAVMQKARSNQSRAAQMLGLNRGTLRKKLRQYDMLE
jgi:Fis family transcriptional regulator, factor for inversion stimulation protein